MRCASVEDQERNLIAASQEIGAVYEMAAWASFEIAGKLPKPVDELTVGELRQLLAHRS